MKKLNDISLKISEEEYHNLKVVSHSKLHDYMKNGFKAVEKILFKEPSKSEAFTFGSLVDIMITEPEMFDQKVVCMMSGNPSEKVKSIIERIRLMAEHRGDNRNLESILYDKDYDGEILGIMNEEVYYNSSSFDSRIKKIASVGSEYYEFLKNSKGKIVVDTKLIGEAEMCVNALKDNLDTYSIIFGHTEGIERFFQLKFVTDVYGVKYSFMPDIVIVDHNKKEVVIYDLKTTGKSLYEFPQNYIDYGYWLQQDSYVEGLENIVTDEPELDCFEYNVIWGGFVVISRKSMECAIFNVNIDMIAMKTSLFGGLAQSALTLSEYIRKGSTKPSWISDSGVSDITKIVVSNVNDRQIH